jgi:hypothetical protein
MRLSEQFTTTHKIAVWLNQQGIMYQFSSLGQTPCLVPTAWNESFDRVCVAHMHLKTQMTRDQLGEMKLFLQGEELLSEVAVGSLLPEAGSGLWWCITKWTTPKRSGVSWSAIHKAS